MIMLCIYQCKINFSLILQIKPLQVKDKSPNFQIQFSHSWKLPQAMNKDWQLWYILINWWICFQVGHLRSCFQHFEVSVQQRPKNTTNTKVMLLRNVFALFDDFLITLTKCKGNIRNQSLLKRIYVNNTATSTNAFFCVLVWLR